MYILRSNFPGLGWETDRKGRLLMEGYPSHQDINTNLVDIQFPTKADAETFAETMEEFGAKCWPSPLEEIPAQ